MFRAFFGGLASGRLARLPFLGFWVLLAVLLVLYGAGIAFGIGVAEPLIFEGPAAARDWLLAHCAPPALALLGLFCLLFVWAQLNLLAKRIRDMGLPGWTVLLLIVLMAAGLVYALPPGGTPLDPSTYGILLLALLLIPSGLFTRRTPLAPIGRPTAGSQPVDADATAGVPPTEQPLATTPASGNDQAPLDAVAPGNA